MKNKILISILIILTFITVLFGYYFLSKDNEIIETKKEYSFLEHLEHPNDLISYKELNDKYIGANLSDISFVNSTSGETVRLSEVSGPKIIEIFSGFCSNCMDGLPAFWEFKELNKDNVTCFMVSKEYNKSEIEKVKEKEPLAEIYYFPSELPPVVGKIYNIAIPAYIVVDENNVILEITAGKFNMDKASNMFSEINDKLNVNIEEE